MERAERETYSTITLMLGEEEDALLWFSSYGGLFRYNFCMLWRLPTVYIWSSIIWQTNNMNFSFYKRMNQTVSEEAVVVDCRGRLLKNNTSSKHPNSRLVSNAANMKDIWFRETKNNVEEGGRTILPVWPLKLQTDQAMPHNAFQPSRCNYSE